VRHSALPAPGSEEQLRNIAGRLFSQGLDRSKPLWELWLIQGLEKNRFALVTKTHHALVDGVSGVDIATVLFDVKPVPEPIEPDRDWVPKPAPSSAELAARGIAELSETPFKFARRAVRAASHPMRTTRKVVEAGEALGEVAWNFTNPAPDVPLNTEIGSHRRFAWTRSELGDFKRIKDALGGTVNDVVLAVVTGALRDHMLRRGRDPGGVELKAMVPVSIRADEERGALGNRVAAMYAPLPVGITDPIERFKAIHEALGHLKSSGQAVGAERLTQLAGFAVPTVLNQAARLQSRQRFFNLTVTNVPGPQFPLFMMGRRLQAFYPKVPLVLNTALGIAIMSYDGKLFFGLLGDYDEMADIDDFASDLRAAIAELATAAGVPPNGGRRSGRARPAARRTKSRA
jgi:diacylglycerol O-acyltransferase / wax synthase